MNHSLKVACSTKNLKQIRAFLEKALKDYALPEEEGNLLILAVDEICANVIIHSNNSNEKNELEVIVKENEEGLVFEILDSGKPFDQSDIQEPDLQTIIKEKKKGGLGLMLVRRIMDTIELTKQDERTMYRLIKKWPLF